jgi:hypothetical protein
MAAQRAKLAKQNATDFETVPDFVDRRKSCVPGQGLHKGSATRRPIPAPSLPRVPLRPSPDIERAACPPRARVPSLPVPCTGTCPPSTTTTTPSLSPRRRPSSPSTRCRTGRWRSSSKSRLPHRQSHPTRWHRAEGRAPPTSTRHRHRPSCGLFSQPMLRGPGPCPSPLCDPRCTRGESAPWSAALVWRVVWIPSSTRVPKLAMSHPIHSSSADLRGLLPSPPRSRPRVLAPRPRPHVLVFCSRSFFGTNLLLSQSPGGNPFEMRR